MHEAVLVTDMRAVQIALIKQNKYMLTAQLPMQHHLGHTWKLSIVNSTITERRTNEACISIRHTNTSRHQISFNILSNAETYLNGIFFVYSNDSALK